MLTRSRAFTLCKISQEELIRKYNLKHCYVKLEPLNGKEIHAIKAVRTQKKTGRSEELRPKVSSDISANAMNSTPARKTLLQKNGIKQCYVRLERVNKFTKNKIRELIQGDRNPRRLKSAQDFVKFLPVKAPIKIPTLILHN